MYKVTTTVANSVNDDEGVSVQIAVTYAEAEEQVAKIQRSVDEWNAPEPNGGYGGKMSIRYLDSEVEQIDDDTSLSNLTVGMLKQILYHIDDTFGTN